MFEVGVVLFSVIVAYLVTFYGKDRGSFASLPSRPITPTPKEE